MRRMLIVGMMALMGTSAIAAPLPLAIKSASVQPSTFGGEPTIVVELEPSTRQAFAKLTTRHVGAILDLLIDGAVVSSPRIQTPIVEGSVVISGSFTASEAAALARRISAGEALVAVDLATP